MLARQPEDGQRAESDRERLRHEQEVGARPDPPQRREDDENRIHVRRQARDLLAVEICHAQRISMSRRPDGLHHVAEVEATRRERQLA